MTILIGQTLVERYRVLHPITHHRTGGVYRAVDLVEGRDVAIKVYQDVSADIEYAFRDIAHRLSELEHPQLPTVYDIIVIEDEGQYLVTSYVDGVDLQSLIDQYRRLPVELVLAGARAACLPLSYLHGHDLFHLNVKPTNIRITPDGDIFLVDFALPGSEIDPSCIGCAAPELVQHTEIGEACDIYAMGATVYSALTGQMPPAAALRSADEAALQPITDFNPDVPAYLDGVIARAMALNPRDRYRTIEGFSAALGSHTAATGIEILANIFGLR